MRKEDMNIAIGIAGLAAAILLFGGKGKADDSGYGGAFPLPLQMQDPGTIVPTQTLSTALGFDISPKILEAMNNPFLPNSVSFSQSAENTIGATQGSVSSFLGGQSSTKKSIVSIPAWMGGDEFTRNVNKLQGEGYTYKSVDPGGSFVFEKTLTTAAAATKKSAAVASGQLYGYQSGAGGGYGGIAAVSGGSAGASGYRSGGTGSWTSAGYTTRY